MVPSARVALLAAAAVAVSGGSLPLIVRASPKALDGYNIVPLQWIGVIEDGQPEVTLNGTLQEVEAQIRVIKPEFSWNDISRTQKEDQITRIKRSKSGMHCGYGGAGTIETGTIRDGSRYLRSVGGKCTVGAGPMVCSRISCSYDGGIWLCNDNPWPIEPMCDYLATYVDDLIDDCQVAAGGGSVTNVEGQEFDTDHYNVIVGYTEC